MQRIQVLQQAKQTQGEPPKSKALTEEDRFALEKQSYKVIDINLLNQLASYLPSEISQSVKKANTEEGRSLDGFELFVINAFRNHDVLTFQPGYDLSNIYTKDESKISGVYDLKEKIAILDPQQRRYIPYEDRNAEYADLLKFMEFTKEYYKNDGAIGSPTGNFDINAIKELYESWDKLESKSAYTKLREFVVDSTISGFGNTINPNATSEIMKIYNSLEEKQKEDIFANVKENYKNGTNSAARVVGKIFDISTSQIENELSEKGLYNPSPSSIGKGK